MPVVVIVCVRCTGSEVLTLAPVGRFWKRISRLMSKLNPEPNLIHIMGCYVLGSANGEKVQFMVCVCVCVCVYVCVCVCVLVCVCVSVVPTVSIVPLIKILQNALGCIRDSCVTLSSALLSLLSACHM